VEHPDHGVARVRSHGGVHGVAGYAKWPTGRLDDLHLGPNLVMCLPDFDSDACFASVLGTPANGRWKIAPAGRVREVQRRYVEETLDNTLKTTRRKPWHARFSRSCKT